MPSHSYSFSTAQDEINSAQLLDEIRSSAITIVVSSATVAPVSEDQYQLTVTFKAELSEDEEIILNSLVQNHVADFSPPTATVILGHVVKETGQTVTGPHASDGKLRVLSSHKPVIKGKESWNYFCSSGDVVASGTVGGGQPLRVICTSGSSTSFTDFEFLNNAWPSEHIYIFGGAIAWENAGAGDCFNLEIRAKPTPIVPAVVASGLGLATDYNLNDTKIYYAGPGSGTHALGGLPVMVQNFRQSGHWDLDKINMVPIPNFSQTGNFDWHTEDVMVGNYINDLLLRGTHYVPQIIDATESAPVPFGYYFRLKCHNNSNSNWELWGFLRMYRERLI